MRIGIDARTLMDRNYSGVSEYTYNLLKELIRLDRNSRFVLFYNSARDISSRVPDFKQDNVSVVHTRYPNKIFNYIMQAGLQRPRLDELLQVDRFLMPHINFAALSGKARSFLTVHDLSFMLYPRFFSARQNIWHRFIGPRGLIRRFDRIITVSRSSQQDIVRLCGCDPGRVSVIHSGVGRQYRPLGRNTPEADRIRKKYNLPGRYAFFLGTIEPRKNVEGLIKGYELACRENSGLRELKLVVAGARGWKAGRIYRAWQNSPLKENIRFLGYVNSEDKPYLYNLAEFFAYPSFYEGFGFPPLEAMACGCPVLTSSVSSLPEICGRAALLADPYDHQSIADGIAILANDKPAAGKLAQAGLKRASRYNWEKTAKQYRDLIFY